MLLFLSHLLKWDMFWGTLKAGFSVQKSTCGTLLSIWLTRSALLHNCLHCLERRIAFLKLHAQTSIFKVYLFLLYQFKSSELGKRNVPVPFRPLPVDAVCPVLHSSASLAGSPGSNGGCCSNTVSCDAGLAPDRAAGRERWEAGASCFSPSPLVMITSQVTSWQWAGKNAWQQAPRGNYHRAGKRGGKWTGWQ